MDSNILDEFKRLPIVDSVVAGLIYHHDGGGPDYLLHPRDGMTIISRCGSNERRISFACTAFPAYRTAHPDNNMTDSIHGHDVMHMIADTRRAFSKAGLVSEIQQKFGEAARFHTCSADNMSAGELVDFLIARGKFTGEPNALTLDTREICQH